jgi:tRNA G18 (ribose-2'-O)-methylase SpoU
MPVECIHTADDPRLASYRGLHMHGEARRDGLFVAESRQIVRQLLRSTRLGVRSVLLTDAGRTALADDLERRPDVLAYVAPLPVLKAVVGFDFHRGCLALGERGPEPTVDDVLATEPHRLVLLEGVSNPDNVGGTLRVARALGADVVLLSPGCADPLHRKVVRVSMGAALDLPWARPVDWEHAIYRLRAAGFTLTALTPRGDVDVAALGREVAIPGRCALVLGAEGDGLRETTLAECQLRLRIPMAEGVDSLNVVTACAVALDRLGGARQGSDAVARGRRHR